MEFPQQPVSTELSNSHPDDHWAEPDKLPMLNMSKDCDPYCTVDRKKRNEEEPKRPLPQQSPRVLDEIRKTTRGDEGKTNPLLEEIPTHACREHRVNHSHD
jgi:hypothetical protein